LLLSASFDEKSWYANEDAATGMEPILPVGGSSSQREPPQPFRERAFPYVLQAELRQPEFMEVAVVLMFGPREKVVIRGKSERALRRRARQCGFGRQLDKTPRLDKLTIHYRAKELLHIEP
jgi:hypothetical protein